MGYSRVVAAIACCAYLIPFVMAFRGAFESYSTPMILGLVFIGLCTLGSSLLLWLVSRRRQMRDMEREAEGLRQLMAMDMADEGDLQRLEEARRKGVAASDIPQEVLQRAAKRAPRVLFAARLRQLAGRRKARRPETV